MPFTGEVRKIKPLELLECSKIAAICFEYANEEELSPQEYYEKVWNERDKATHRSSAYPMESYVALQNGQIASTIVAMPFAVNFDGTVANMCGIGGVCTLPQYRRLGSVRAIFQEMLHCEKEKGTEFSYLYPFSQKYYEQFGYYMSDPKVEYTCGLSHLKKTDSPDSISLYDGNGNIDAFMKAYARMNQENKFNFMIHRERCDFGKVLNADPCKKNEFAYLFSDAEQNPCGYMVFHQLIEDGSRLIKVEELCYNNAKTFSGMMGFMAGFAADYKAVRFEAPLSQPLDFICTDQSQGLFEKKINKNGMLRVIDVVKVLEKAKYRGSGEAVLEIEDDILDRTYHLAVQYKDGVLTDLDKTKREPDAAIPIGLFSAAIAGRYSDRDWEWMQGKPLPKGVAGIFYKKDIYINNFF